MDPLERTPVNSTDLDAVVARVNLLTATVERLVELERKRAGGSDPFAGLWPAKDSRRP